MADEPKSRTRAAEAVNRLLNIYFSMVRRRMDRYLQVMAHFADATDPGRVIGPAFGVFFAQQLSSSAAQQLSSLAAL